MLSLKRILLIVDGPGVMTHTAPLVTSLLRQGVAVRVALTESARLLVGDYFTTMLSGTPLVRFPESLKRYWTTATPFSRRQSPRSLRRRFAKTIGRLRGSA